MSETPGHREFEGTIGDDATIAADGLRPGKLLGERYLIEHQLGAGGMGEVWRAKDTALDDMIVALKVVPAILARHERTIDRLKVEATIAIRLAHPNICRLHNFHHEGGQKFLVMEYIAGQTLEQIFDQRDEPFLWEELRPVIERIGEALDYAHGLTPPVLHMDIKPANIMISEDGRPYLLDFGIAREIRDSVTRITGREDTSGTVPYMSPEQFRGERVGTASDIYSFSCVVYEALTGEPFVSTGGSLAWQVQEKPFVPTGELDERAERFLRAGLTKDPAERATSVRELLAIADGDAEAPEPPAAPVAPPAPPPIESPPAPPPPVAAPQTQTTTTASYATTTTLPPPAPPMQPRPVPPPSGSESQAVGALVMSLIGFALASACGPIGSIIAVIAAWMAHSARNKARARGQTDAMAKAALILSIIAVVMGLLWCGVFGIAMVAETM